MELKTYFTILARRWQVVVLVVLVAVGLAIFASRYVDYEAETRLQVITPMGGSLGYTYYETTFANRLMNTYAQIATSNQLKSELKKELGLDVLPNITVKIIPDSEIIQIIVESRDPALAAKTANTLAELIINRQEKVVAGSPSSEELTLLEKRKEEFEVSIAEAQQEYNDLVQGYSQTTSKIAILERAMALKDEAYQNILDQYQRAQQAGAVTQAKTLGEELSSLEREMEAFDQEYEDLSVASNTYSQQILMARQVIQSQQGMYADLVARYDNVYSSLLKEARSQNILIISPAVEATEPMLSPVFLAVLGFLGGVIGGIVAAFVVDNLDTRIYTSDQVDLLTETPVLGAFPRLNRKQMAYQDTLFYALHGDFLMFRKRIIKVFQNRRMKIILVSSPNPQEGKSTVLAGIASILAANRSRVLLVDANLYKPHLHNLYSITEGGDIYTFLNDESCRIEDVIHKNVKPGIDLLPCLSGVDDASEFFQSDRFKVLFEKASTYDYILVDTSALMFSPEAYSLTSSADGVLVVVRRGRTTSGDIRSVSKYLEDISGKLLGFVINQTPMKLAYAHAKANRPGRFRVDPEKTIPRHS
ncbi:MAG: AAA family ATPase [Anaerolineales bacterium]|nr:AAA family ATPase [Anaerolineales bacterium]